MLKFNKYICASVLVLALSACAAEERRTVNKAAHGKNAPLVDVAAPKGLNDKVYFDEDIQAAIASLRGMESTLNRIEADLENTTLQRLTIMRASIHETNRQLEELQYNLRAAGIEKPITPLTVPSLATPQEITGELARSDVQAAALKPEPVKMAPIAEPAKPAPIKAEPIKVAPKIDGVSAARIGVHPDKTRIVFDINGSAPKHSSHFDAAEGLLTIELANTAWHAAKDAKLSNSPQISGYSTDNSDAGSIIVIAVKEGAKPGEPKWIAGQGGGRLMLDIQ